MMIKNVFRIIQSSKKLKNNKISAFTLAELLITLSILGVVAAITIPSAIKSNTNKATILKVKKMYSMLESALGQATVANNNDSINVSDYYNDPSKVYNDLIKPYIKINYDAGTNTSKKQKIIYCDKIKLLNGDTYIKDYCDNELYYVVQLKDGSALYMRGPLNFDNNNQNQIAFTYDVNGKQGPNTLGIDIFGYNIYPADSRNVQMTKPTLAINACPNGEGWTCGNWILQKGNMDYLKCVGNYDYDNDKCN